MDLCLRRGEAGYPARLLELSSPPSVLYVRGAWPASSPSVAIVGSRGASTEGLHLAQVIARGLAEAGVVVVSGGALGVDGMAHTGALDGGGSTIVVLPTPLASPAPRAHRALFARVLDAGGAWVTEQTGATERHHFSTRNRIIAALADVTLVVEAHAGSGTRYTVRAARALGRPLAAVPWAVGDPRGAGNLDVLTGGGRAVTSAADVLAMLGRPRKRRDKRVTRAPDGATALARRLVAALGAGPVELEPLAACVGATVTDVLGALTELELDGVVARLGGRIELRR